MARGLRGGFTADVSGSDSSKMWKVDRFDLREIICFMAYEGLRSSELR